MSSIFNLARSSYSSSNSNSPRNSNDITIELEKPKFDNTNNFNIQRKVERISIYPFDAGRNALQCKRKKQIQKEWEKVDLYFKSLFYQIRRYELEAQIKAGENNGKATYETYQKFVKMSNAFCFWITSEILAEGTPKKRALIIRRAIKMAEYFLKQGNFQLFNMTIAGLESYNIERLDKTWNLLPTKVKKQEKHYASLCSGKGYLSRMHTLTLKFKGSYLPHLCALKGCFSTTNETKCCAKWDGNEKSLQNTIGKDQTPEELLVKLYKNKVQLKEDTECKISKIFFLNRYSKTIANIESIKTKEQEGIDLNEMFYQKSLKREPLPNKA